MEKLFTAEEVKELMDDFWHAGFSACVDKHRWYTSEELWDIKMKEFKPDEDLEQCWEEVDQIASRLEESLTSGLVHSGEPYSSCFPSETSYCDGVERGMEELKEQLKEKFYLVKK